MPLTNPWLKQLYWQNTKLYRESGIKNALMMIMIIIGTTQKMA